MEKRIEKLLSQLTLEEKITLLSGSSTMKTSPVARLGIHSMEMADGPQGVRATGQPGSENTTGFPCAVTLAASFNTEMAEKYGKAVAKDCKALGIASILGPGLNLMRTPLCGRNFEYFGEDPCLAGKTAAGYVRGCQEENIAATPKHLALNNQEICRTTSSSDIDERTLRELYLTAFEIVTKEAQPWMLMSSYNRINGTFAAENGVTQDLITKREWGFDGVMVCDWGGAHDTLGCALGGLDLEMPGPGFHFTQEKLLPLVKSGMIPISLIDEKVRRILRLLCRTKAIDGDITSGNCGGEFQLDTARECAAESIVMLKNQNDILPLDTKKIKKILLTGPNADFRHHRGTLRIQGGSGAVFTEREVTILAGLQKFAAANDIELQYIQTARFDNDAVCPEGFFGRDGVKCSYYPDKESMAKKENLLFENSNHTGIWNFNVASSQFANNDSSAETLPEKGFAMHLAATLHLPENCAGSKLIFSPNSDFCLVKLNGKIIWENNDNSMNYFCDIDPKKMNNALLEVEYVSEYPQFASFSITFNNPQADAEAEKQLLAAAKNADAVIFAGGRNHMDDKEALGWGNFYTADIPSLQLRNDQDKLICALAEVNPNTIVTLTGGGVMDVEKWIDKVASLLMLWYPGEAGGEVLSDILSGKINPSGRLPFSWARDVNFYPCHANGNYPGNREDEDPRVRYDEGIFIGYRHFDRTENELRFPFGYGLSYSEFNTELISCRQTGSSTFDAGCTVTVKVTNTSGVSGKEVIQIYTGSVAPEFPRPVKELKAFAKIELAPGESKEVEFTLLPRDFACFHPELHHWYIPAGEYKVFLARNAADIIGTATLEFK